MKSFLIKKGIEKDQILEQFKELVFIYEEVFLKDNE